MSFVQPWFCVGLRKDAPLTRGNNSRPCVGLVRWACPRAVGRPAPSRTLLAGQPARRQQPAAASPADFPTPPACRCIRAPHADNLRHSRPPRAPSKVLTLAGSAVWLRTGTSPAGTSPASPGSPGKFFESTIDEVTAWLHRCAVTKRIVRARSGPAGQPGCAHDRPQSLEPSRLEPASCSPTATPFCEAARCCSWPA